MTTATAPNLGEFLRDTEEDRESKAFQLFVFMADQRWYPYWELYPVAGRKSARMGELRGLGFRFETRRYTDPAGRHAKGYSYRLVSLEPGPPSPVQADVKIYEDSLEPLLDLLVYVREQAQAGAPGFDRTHDLPDVIRAIRKAINTPRPGRNLKLREQCVQHGRQRAT